MTIRSLILFVLTSLAVACHSQTLRPSGVDSVATVAVDDTLTVADTVPVAHRTPRRPWLAAAEVVAANLGILAFDHYVLDAEFAKVTWRTVGRNFSPSKWYWDSDIFRTNLMLHPYHGSIYYNAARSNGLNFYESIPFAVGGSLMWEIAGEMEHPSINDFLATSVSGLAIGEVTHRLAERIYDNRSRGAERVGREIVGALLNPAGGFTRLVTGNTFRLTNGSLNDLEIKQLPLEFSVLLGGRFLGTNQGEQSHRLGGTLNFDFIYGSPVEPTNSKPYDFFRANIGFDLSGGESTVGNLNIIGQIRQWMLTETDANRLSLGIYQHFDYYATDSIHGKTPYKISEAASVGAGLAWCRQKHDVRLSEELYVNGVLLGGALSDYRENRYKREYSVGSGYSLKSITGIDIAWWLRVRLLADMKHLFSWHGYEDEDPTKEYIEYSVMGDRGSVVSLLLRPSLELLLNRHWGIETSAFFVFRDFHYKYHPDVSSTAYDYRVGVKYRF